MDPGQRMTDEELLLALEASRLRDLEEGVRRRRLDEQFPNVRVAVRRVGRLNWFVDVWHNDEILTYQHSFTRLGGWLRVGWALWADGTAER